MDSPAISASPSDLTDYELDLRVSSILATATVAAPDSRYVPPILKLPNEVLIEIAKQVDGNNSLRVAFDQYVFKSKFRHNLYNTLHNVSLTCRRFRPIGQAVLLKSIPVRLNRLWSLVKLLLRHPHVDASAIRYVRECPPYV
jgi:hypothetical protein